MLLKSSIIDRLPHRHTCATVHKTAYSDAIAFSGSMKIIFFKCNNYCGIRTLEKQI